MLLSYSAANYSSLDFLNVSSCLYIFLCGNTNRSISCIMNSFDKLYAVETQVMRRTAIYEHNIQPFVIKRILNKAACDML